MVLPKLLYVNNPVKTLEKISGIGIDLVDVNKFRKKPFDSNRSFYQKIFSKNEIQYCLKFKNSSEHFAGKFGLKESVKKAISPKIPFIAIETSHSNSKPIVKINHNSYKKYLIHASLSHEKDFAIGFVIVQKSIN